MCCVSQLSSTKLSITSTYTQLILSHSIKVFSHFESQFESEESCFIDHEYTTVQSSGDENSQSTDVGKGHQVCISAGIL